MSDSDGPIQIPSSQIKIKKKIGTLHGEPVILVSTVGGLSMVVSPQDGKVKTLGVGSHKSIAKHIASKRNPDIQWTELNKADEVETEHFEFLLPKYETLTDSFQAEENS